MSDQVSKLPRFDYLIHPLASLNPMMNPEEQASLELDVRENGFIEPIALAKTPKGVQVVDGRNRLITYNKLADEGVTQTNKGDPITLPTFYLDNVSPLAILEYVISKSRRRNETKSQKACHAVRATKEMERFLKKEGKKLEITGDKADWISAQFGVNRLYVVNAGTLFDEATDLFDAVFTNVYPLSKAMQRLKRRQKGLPEDPNEVHAAGGTGGTDDKEVSDDNGVVIKDKELLSAWEVKGIIRDGVSSLTAALGFVEKAAEHVGGRWIELDPIKSIFKTLKSVIQKSAPHIVCPTCEGHPSKKKTCKDCKGAGFLCRRAVASAAAAAAPSAPASTAADAPAEKPAKAKKGAKADKGEKPPKAKKNEAQTIRDKAAARIERQKAAAATAGGEEAPKDAFEAATNAE